MGYLVSVTDFDDQLVYEQVFYELNISRFVKELNDSYWASTEPPKDKKEVDDEIA